MQGIVIAAHGRQYVVAPDDGGAPLSCFPRGKKSEIAVGDAVAYDSTAPGQGVIEQIAPRRTLFYRSNEFRHKLIAANVDQLFIVVATEPGFSDELVSRCLVAAASQEVPVVLILNKADVAEKLPAAREQLAQFAPAGATVLELSAHQREATQAALQARLHGHTTLLIGQSGMGKSTLINALVPDAQAATREISTVLDSGKHTTTHARLYRLDGNSALIDSPGVQEFGLSHLDKHQVELAFPELRPALGHCRFHNCRHDREPGCALRAGVDNGSIHPRRWASFQALYAAARDTAL